MNTRLSLVIALAMLGVGPSGRDEPLRLDPRPDPVPPPPPRRQEVRITRSALPETETRQMRRARVRKAQKGRR